MDAFEKVVVDETLSIYNNIMQMNESTPIERTDIVEMFMRGGTYKDLNTIIHSWDNLTAMLFHMNTVGGCVGPVTPRYEEARIDALFLVVYPAVFALIAARGRHNQTEALMFVGEPFERFVDTLMRRRLMDDRSPLRTSRGRVRRNTALLMRTIFVEMTIRAADPRSAVLAGMRAMLTEDTTGILNQFTRGGALTSLYDTKSA